MARTVQLSDEQCAAIIRAGFALEPGAREILRRRVIEKLAAVPEIGDGCVFRACRSIQRQLFVPPPDVSQGPRVFQKLR
ncbi:hypothetical protein SAMN05444161_0016 [Rhizobiales bacterium GAS191]|nr:hypothetical protein SAMN05444161_0016 [Rhizobiales bacterium GAS191]